jgi:HTH-type transcriptional regulator/antitoxin HigA
VSEHIAPRPYKAPLAIPPGFTIREMLDDSGMSQRVLAVRMGRPPQAINEIIQGKKAITAETALQLEIVLGMTQKYWLNREASYQAAKERIVQEKSITEDLVRLNNFPYLELVERGVVPEVSGRNLSGRRERVIHLRRFLRVANFSALDDYLKGFGLSARLARTTSLTIEKLAVWLRLGEKQAEDEQWPIVNFKRRVLEDSLAELRKLSLETEYNEIKNTLRRLGEASGVVFLFVKEFKSFPAKGMTVWVNQRPYIMLTLHGKRWDMLWFTLFHEIGHVLLDKRKTFIEGSDLATYGPEEDKADRFAQDTLIAPEDYLRLTSSPITPESVIVFAEEIEIDPSLVVGRLMKEKLIRDDSVYFHALLRPVNWTE